MRSASRNPANRSDAGREQGSAGLAALKLTTSEEVAAADREQRSGYGTVPGAEFPAFVYVSVLAAFAWIMLASWLTFAGNMDADLALGIAVVLAIVFFALPVILRQVAVANSPDTPKTADDFLSSRVETATGSLPATSAWLQVLLIPLALAFAATLIGAAFLSVR